MKKFLSFLIAAAMLLAIMPLSAQAQNPVRRALNRNQRVMDNTSDWLTNNRPCSRILRSRCNPNLSEDGYYWLNRGQQESYDSGYYRSSYYHGNGPSRRNTGSNILRTVVRVVDRVESRREFEKQLEHERRMAQMQYDREAEIRAQRARVRIERPVEEPQEEVRNIGPQLKISNLVPAETIIFDGKVQFKTLPAKTWTSAPTPRNSYWAAYKAGTKYCEAELRLKNGQIELWPQAACTPVQVN